MPEEELHPGETIEPTAAPTTTEEVSDTPVPEEDIPIKVDDSSKEVSEEAPEPEWQVPEDTERDQVMHENAESVISDAERELSEAREQQFKLLAEHQSTGYLEYRQGEGDSGKFSEIDGLLNGKIVWFTKYESGEYTAARRDPEQDITKAEEFSPTAAQMLYETYEEAAKLISAERVRKVQEAEDPLHNLNENERADVANLLGWNNPRPEV